MAPIRLPGRRSERRWSQYDADADGGVFHQHGEPRRFRQRIVTAAPEELGAGGPGVEEEVRMAALGGQRGHLRHQRAAKRRALQVRGDRYAFHDIAVQARAGADPAGRFADDENRHAGVIVEPATRQQALDLPPPGRVGGRVHGIELEPVGHG